MGVGTGLFMQFGLSLLSMTTLRAIDLRSRFVGALILCLVPLAHGQSAPDSGWPTYGNDPGGTRYSPARQIDRANVAKLQVAWTYHTGDMRPDVKAHEKAAFEVTPILVDGKLFLSTPFNHVIALDPRSGGKLWEFDPQVDLSRNYSEVASRGVSAWTDDKAKAGDPCRLRILVGTLDARLIALDGDTGKTCSSFGQQGTVDRTRAAPRGGDR